MSNVESASAAGDSYNLRSVLIADGTGAIVGSALGSPFPPAVYIGHPGWKEAGGRTSYSMASGLAIALLCFLGLFSLLSAILPLPAIVPILLYIGLLIGAQAFQAVPRLHAAAVVAAIIPNLAAWGAGLIDNALAAAGTSAAQLGEASLTNAGLVYHGLHVLGQGAVLAGIVFGAIVTFILERQLFRAAIAAGAGALLSWIGLLHSEEVQWAAESAGRPGLPAARCRAAGHRSHASGRTGARGAGGRRAGTRRVGPALLSRSRRPLGTAAPCVSASARSNRAARHVRRVSPRRPWWDSPAVTSATAFPQERLEVSRELR